MATLDSDDPDKASKRGETQGHEPPPKRAKQDAFAKLMAPKPKPLPKSTTTTTRFFKDRVALGAYIADPASFSSAVVIYHNKDFVAIRDKFPKATVHTLLLPRSPAHSLLHPFDALEDAAFRAKVQAEVAKLKALVATELRRQLGRYSRSDAARQAVLDGDEAEPGGGGPGSGSGPELPPGRDWGAEVRCGVHAVPSMGHLHVHVLSRDMHSPALKHRKHYNSFNTPFLVDMADFPLAAVDPRREAKEEGFMKRNLVCWRCGRNFGNRFKELKDHLEAEFEEWKRE